jgi:hypothetical protein
MQVPSSWTANGYRNRTRVTAIHVRFLGRLAHAKLCRQQFYLFKLMLREHARCTSIIFINNMRRRDRHYLSYRRRGWNRIEAHVENIDI